MRKESQGQAAQPGPDLEHDVVRRQARRPGDAADRVGVDDEVLPPALGRTQPELRGQRADVAAAEQAGPSVGLVDAHHAPNARIALSYSSVHRAPSSTPRSAAIARTVWGMR